MITLENIYGFTGSKWSVPDVDVLSVSELLDSYTKIYYTLLYNGVYYLGTYDDINDAFTDTVARAVLIRTITSVKIAEPIELIKSEYRIVDDATESNGTVTFPSGESLIMNGGQFIITEKNGDISFVRALTDIMDSNNDLIIGTTDLFYDADCYEFNTDNLTKYYETGFICIGGLLIEIRTLYDYLGTGVNLVGNTAAWIPALYKRVAEHISPSEIGITYPLDWDILSSVTFYNRLVAEVETGIVNIKSPTPVTMISNPIPRIFPQPLTGILCYDGRPSPSRVTKMYGGYKCPTKNDLYPQYADIGDGSGKYVGIDYVVKDIQPREHFICYVNYEVLS